MLTPCILHFGHPGDLLRHCTEAPAWWFSDQRMTFEVIFDSVHSFSMHLAIESMFAGSFYDARNRDKIDVSYKLSEAN
jgi:hypothetical protein